jgi:hypothetical protein
MGNTGRPGIGNEYVNRTHCSGNKSKNRQIELKQIKKQFKKMT